MSTEAVYRLATEKSPEIQPSWTMSIFLLVPSLNPDGQIMVIDWYNKNLGTPYENAPRRGCTTPTWATTTTGTPTCSPRWKRS